jgi:deoxyribonuclease-4
MTDVRWGVHTSIDGQTMPILLRTFAETGMKCLQIFFGSPKSLERKKLTPEDTAKCAAIVKDNNLSFNTHFPYTYNMCNDSLNMGPLQAEIDRVSAIGGRVILHTGSCTSACCENRKLDAATPEKKESWGKDWRKGADILIAHLNKLKFPNNVQYPLLLEPPAGEGKKLGWHIDQLQYIFERCPPQVGFCLDTCHAFAAGLCRFQTMDQIIELFDRLEIALGDMKRFRLIHLNDSLDPYLSMKDNHASLKKGTIWSKPETEEGLLSLFLMSGEYNVDIVSEVGLQNDIDVMKDIVKQIKDAPEQDE